MNELTNKEFWILWKHRNGKPFDVHINNAFYLLNNGYLVLSGETSSDVDKFESRFKLCVSREGVRAAEHHKDSYFEARWVSLRAWVSLGISALALVVSIISICL